MSWSAVRLALRARLVGFVSLPLISYERRPFTATVGVPYVRESLKPAGNTVASLGSPGLKQKLIRHNGLYLLDCFFPSIGTFTNEDEVSDGLVEWFVPGLQLVSGGITTTILTSSRLASVLVNDPSWRMIPVNITLRFDTFE